MTDTQANVGTRKEFLVLGYRNFERSGTVQYEARRDNLNFMGTIYNIGDDLPFDVASTSYSAAAMGQLQLFWDFEFITPLT